MNPRFGFTLIALPASGCGRRHPARLAAPLLALAALMATGPAQAGGSVERGKEAVQKYACASCHGADFNSPIDASYPRLAGQHPDYLAQALRAYRRPGGRLEGRSNPVMQGMAAQLSPREVDDVAAYLGALPGTLVTRR
ncbi:c-type cytochrome [Derxia lacustris]|uniref:c-type cytochrome n=1 Tax=Derxia lacustris TaxID=764842 RepID=UPI001F2018DF|nr:cytochrome c [Derxia lacustris]